MVQQGNAARSGKSSTVVDQENTEDAAVALDRQVRALATDIDKMVTKLHQLVAQAKEMQIHEHLDGYASWESWVKDVTANALPNMSRFHKAQVASVFLGVGMSQRAVAEIVKLSVGKVNAIGKETETRKATAGQPDKAPNRSKDKAIKPEEKAKRHLTAFKGAVANLRDSGKLYNLDQVNAIYAEAAALVDWGKARKEELKAAAEAQADASTEAQADASTEALAAVQALGRRSDDASVPEKIQVPELV